MLKTIPGEAFIGLLSVTGFNKSFNKKTKSGKKCARAGMGGLGAKGF